MLKQTIGFISVVIPLMLLNSASAMILWDAGGADNLWSTAANWNPDVIPTKTDPVSIDDPNNTHCEVTDGIAAVCETLRVGNGGVTTNLDISGG